MATIPEDVIYNIIFPFLNHRDGCNLTEPQIVLVNKRMSAKSKHTCVAPKLYFGRQKWCSVHTPNEYNFSQYLKQQIDRDRTLTGMFEDIGPCLTYHDSNRFFTPDVLLYYWNRVLEKTSYQVDHLCCRGTGVTFSKRPGDQNSN